jgi:hypothetical protein
LICVIKGEAAMKTGQMEASPRYWNDQQLILRRLLMKDQDFHQALPVFLGQHAMIHTARLVQSIHWSCQDEVLSGLTDEQMRYIPQGRPHSVAWSILHITRIEDVTMNLLLAGSPQVLHSGNWLDKLEIAYGGVGNEMSLEDIARLSQAINLKALLAYRLAVGKRTRQLVRRIKPNQLWESPSPERLTCVVEERAVSEKASWLLNYWGRNATANLLLMPATRHGFAHLNEIRRMLPKLRRLEAS